MELKNKIYEALKEVYDPEFPMDVVTLGLIYDLKIDEDKEVNVLMTLTTPQCPLADVFLNNVKEAIEKVEGVKKANVELTFDPLWTPDKIKMDEDDDNDNSNDENKQEKEIREKQESNQ